MLRKKKPEYKIMFNNYQFYENAALLEYLEKQKAEGYCPCGFIGESCNILKFCYENPEGTKKPYAIFRKHLDKQIDEEIENRKTGKGEILCQNNQYIIFRVDPSEAADMKPDSIEMKQNSLLGVSVKKCAIFVSILLVLSVISLILKILLIEKGNIYFNSACFALYLVLLGVFLIYFIGDIHDMIAGKGTCVNGALYFTSRTKFKDRLFRIGDILKWGILLGSICASIAAFFVVKDEILAVNVLKMWLIFCCVAFIYRLRVQRSYISLLVAEVFLAALSFL